MIRLARFLIPFFIFAASAINVSSDARAAEPDDARLKKILADWQKRQNRVDAVEYKVSGVHKVPQGAYNTFPAIALGLQPEKIPPVFPERDLTGPIGFTILLDFVKGRHRRDRQEQIFSAISGKLEQEMMKDTFNGSVMRCQIPKKDNPHQKNISMTKPEMSILSGNMKSGAFKSNYYPIFFGHGRIYTHMEQIIPGKIRNNPDQDYLYIHGTGVHDGRRCLIVRSQTLKTSTTAFVEYWVDTSRESAIVRYVSYSGAKPSAETTIRYSNGPSGWLPASWHWTFYSHGQTLYYEDMRVEKVNSHPSFTDSDFEMEAQPGMLVEEVESLPTKHPIATPKSKLSVYRLKEGGEREYVPDPYRREGDQYRENNLRKK